MKRTVAALIASIAVLAASPGLAHAAASPEMQTMQYLIGNWDCTYTVGSRKGATSLNFASAFDGAWLAETMFVETGSGKAAHSIHYTGYDAKAKKWFHVGPNRDGSFDVAASPDGFQWQTILPTTTEQLTFKRISDTEFTEEASFPAGQEIVKFNQICKKAQS